MEAKVTAPADRAIHTSLSGHRIDIEAGKSITTDLSGDLLADLERLGCSVRCVERDAGPPKGSKAWLARQPAPTKPEPKAEKSAPKGEAPARGGGA